VAAYRCSLCAINYPVRQNFQRCPIHGEPNQYLMHGQETENWEWAATAKSKTNDVEKNLTAVPPVMPVEIRQDEDGMHWISSLALISLGLQSRLEPDFVLQIPRANPRPDDGPCDEFWEVQSYRESTREYWVRPLRVPDFAPAN